MQFTELEAAARLAIAVLIGTGVGLEREWSGQTTGPNRPLRRPADVSPPRPHRRRRGAPAEHVRRRLPAAVVIAGGDGAGDRGVRDGGAAAIERRRRHDGGGRADGHRARRARRERAGSALAAGAGSIVVLALSEKTRLHWFVGRVSEAELHATLQFAVLALVVLPILPEGPFGGALDIRPRAVWMIVLIFSGLSFAAYLLRRALGSDAGYIVTGLAGGLVSSTARDARVLAPEPQGAAGSATALGVRRDRRLHRADSARGDAERAAQRRPSRSGSRNCSGRRRSSARR